MKILVAADSFKGSLSSTEAGEAIREGILRSGLNCEITLCALADGGEGTTEAFFLALGGEKIALRVRGARGAKTAVEYCILPDGTAVIETAQAAGLPLLAPEERDPMKTTTYGLGEMIRDALSRGVRNFIIGLGGSATNDGGIGMLSALGFSFLTAESAPVSPGAEGLRELSAISLKHAMPELKNCRFTIASDVNNPLCGPSGCSAVFAKQKGATDSDILKMDTWMQSYADLAETATGTRAQTASGAGAAGGLGFAFLCFLNAALCPGFELLSDHTRLKQKIRDCDLIVTGEGRLDSQSLYGKAPVALARLAAEHQKPVIAFAGSLGEEAHLAHGEGITAFFPIVRGPVALDEALEKKHARDNLRCAAEEVFRLLNGR